MISVITPTYNRARLLNRCHESLCRQTNGNLEWIVMDDGSTDDTQDVVSSWMSSVKSVSADMILGKSEKGGFKMTLVRQPHGGKHRALNRGVSLAAGDLILILDSDDYLADNAIETIATHYEQVREDPRFAGVAGRKAYSDGRLVGDPNLGDTMDVSYLDFRHRHSRRGDMCEVFSRKVMLEFPFPEIEGEVFCPEALVWNRISTRYILRYLPKILYHCEYLPDGLSFHITRLRQENAVASMLTYSEMTRHDIPLIQRAKAAINYYRFAICLDKHQPIQGTDNRHPIVPPHIGWQWSWAKPLGWGMHKRDQLRKKQ